MAVTKSASLQPPMPSSRSGEMLGGKNVPNGVLSPSPPPSCVLSCWLGVAWHIAQPPAWNIVAVVEIGRVGRKRTRWNRCGNGDHPKRSSLNHRDDHREHCELAQHQGECSGGQSGSKTKGRLLIAIRAKRLRCPLAVGSMAPDAILAHFGQLNLEAVEVVDCADRRLRVARELGEPRREVGLVLPNRGQCRGIAVLGPIRK